MKRLYRWVSMFIIIAMAACGFSEGFAEAALPQIDDCFTERDLYGDWDATAVEILLVGDTAETRSHTVDIDGGRITIQDGGVYAVSGTLLEGSIVIDVPDDERVQLVLNGVHITCSDGPAVYVKQSDKVFITLAEGTENSLSSAAFSEEGVEAVIYSDEDLTFNGAGSLAIATEQGDGIDGKDDVKFTGGACTITASGRGIDANDSIRISGGSFTITTGGDAIRARHESNEDLGYVYIWGGSFTITTGGGFENGPDHAETFIPGGGMPGGRQPGQPGEMPMPGNFNGEGGEMPMTEGFTGNDGEIPSLDNSINEGDNLPTSEVSVSEDGNMTIAEGFTGEGGEMPTSDNSTGESGDMPTSEASASGDGKMPMPEGFTGEGGEMPTSDNSTGESGNMQTSEASASEGGKMPIEEGFTGEGGEMPTSENSTGEDGEMAPSDNSTDEGDGMSMPEGFTGEGWERPAPGDFTGEMPTPPNFGGDMPAAAESAEEESVSAKGIKASGDIVILGGDFTFDTADDALHANRSLTLFDGTLTISTGDDAIHAEDTLLIMGDATRIDHSYEGLEGKVIRISGGDTTVNATDDGLNAADGELNGESFEAQEGVLIDISGGALYVNAGGDGLDSNGDLQMSGGSVVVSGPEDSFNGSIDHNGDAIITGGTLVAAGASGMTENFSEGSTQAAFLVALSGEAGEITVTDSEGNAIVRATVEKPFGTVVISAPGLAVGETYTVACADTSAEITLTDIVTGSDTGGMAGFPGGGFPGERREGMPDRADDANSN